MTMFSQLKHLCTIDPPKKEMRQRRMNGKDKVSFLPMEDLGIGIKCIMPSKTRTLEEVSGSYTYFAEGDVLLAKVTPCFENGKVGIATDLVNGIGFGSSEFIVIRPDLGKILPDFLYYKLQDRRFREEGRSLMTGACGLKRLPKSFVADTSVFCPPILEQQRIVEILDKEFVTIDALKTNAEKSLQAAKDLFQATMKKELEPKNGWKKYSLKDVCLEYGDYGMSLPSKAYDGVRYLRITDITEWGELNDDRVSVDADVIDEKYMLIDGDVLFARTGATVGKTLVYEDRFGSCCYAGYLIRYRPDQSVVLPRMLYYITHSASYYDWVAVSQKSATLPNISAKLYNAYEVYLPVVEEQRRIIPRLDELYDKCQSLQENYHKTLALCDDLKQALLRKAFNGEL